jgi:hypothetical protein
MGNGLQGLTAIVGGPANELSYTFCIVCSLALCCFDLPHQIQCSLPVPCCPHSYWTMQALWVFITMSPVLVVNTASAAATPLRWLDFVGKRPLQMHCCWCCTCWTMIRVMDIHNFQCIRMCALTMTDTAANCIHMQAAVRLVPDAACCMRL